MLTPGSAVLARPSVVARWAGGSLAAVVIVLTAPVAAAADKPVACPPEQTVCTLQVDTPAHRGGDRAARQTAGTGEAVCRVPDERPEAGTPVPCSVPGLGSWSNTDGCYYQPVQPQPPRSDPAWEGHADGAVYEMTCAGLRGTGGGWVWRATPPAGAGPAVDPAVLAVRLAVSVLLLVG